MDTIVLKKGDALRGKLQHKKFTIVTDIGKLQIPTSEIAQILFNLATYGEKDQIFTSGSRFSGDIQEDPIRLKLEDGGSVVEVAQAKILAIHVGS